MIKVTDLTVRYGGQPALEDVSFTVGRGEFVLLSGPSGCGKSTLARSLNGFIPHAWPHPSTGSGHRAAAARAFEPTVRRGEPVRLQRADGLLAVVLLGLGFGLALWPL